jgi:hypothetical protein
MSDYLLYVLTLKVPNKKKLDKMYIQGQFYAFFS